MQQAAQTYLHATGRHDPDKRNPKIHCRKKLILIRI